MNSLKKIACLIAIMCVFCTCKKESPIDTVSVNGALSGEFSVAKNRIVHFSQGNLQHPDKNSWYFATNQWECGDLFEWSYMIVDSDSVFVDWGQQPIINGGNKPNQWRTLTKDEWIYLFHGRSNAGYLFGFGKVNGINGVIILPDNGAGMFEFNSAFKQGLEWTYNEWTYEEIKYQRYYYKNTTQSDLFSHNTFKGEKWHKMEEKGAVFLPAAGNFLLSENSGQPIGTYGDYWSATIDNTAEYRTDSYCLDFHNGGLLPMCGGSWNYCFSVRLVQ